ncbi:MAG TPA: thioredoxin family protein [Candidatus Sulfotelmatobacter sp.]|jgi:thioredoxin-related protein|nr:thioredoxin family protein [Candidatus Sulfotelmatobacter sp.]
MNKIVFLVPLIAGIAFIGCTPELKVDMSKAVVLDTNAPPVNLAEKIQTAKAENKLLLLEFGSSDACPPCVALQQRVFSTPEFMAYEQANLVFIRIDFPFKVTLPPPAHDTNELLEQQFKVFGYPTFIALNQDGKEVWRMPKSPDEGIDLKIFSPTNFIAMIEGVKKHEK